MSRFPRPQFSNYYGPPLGGGPPCSLPNQPQRVPFPYNQGRAVPFPGRPQLQHRFLPPHIRPAGRPHHSNQTRPQFRPRVEPRPRYEARLHKGNIEGHSIEDYYKHSMVENPWRDLEAKMKDSLDE